MMHACANVLLIALTLAGGAWHCGGWWLVQRPGHALRSVSIDAMPGTDMRHVSSLLLGQAVRQRLKGNFFTIDLDLVRAGFEQVPWVRRATVRRIWPNRLAVSIEEHRPLALWGDGRLLNTFGELYTANLAEAEEDGPLPHFAGPPGSESRVLTRYEEMRRWLAPLGRTPQALVLSARYAWAAQLDDGTRLMLGRDQGRADRGASGALGQRVPEGQGAAGRARADRRPALSEWLRRPRDGAGAGFGHVGLDIGTSKMWLIVARRGRDRRCCPRALEIVGLGSHESKGLKKGVVVNIESTVAVDPARVEEAELMADCKIKEVYTGIAGSHIRSFNSHGMVAIKDKEVTEADVERVIETAQGGADPADQQILHVLPQEFIIDGQEASASRSA
jgi:cell division protein FtsQ